MIQIQSGIFRGKNIRTATEKTLRPTKSIVRAAVFNILRSRTDLDNFAFCDVFGGSGVMGLEAFSNGCHPVLIYELNPETYRVLNRVVAEFPHNGQVQTFCRSFSELPVLPSALSGNTVYYLDPPYARPELFSEFKSRLDGFNPSVQSVQTLLILETAQIPSPEFFSDYHLITEKSYGYTKLYIFRI